MKKNKYVRPSFKEVLAQTLDLKRKAEEAKKKVELDEANQLAVEKKATAEAIQKQIAVLEGVAQSLLQDDASLRDAIASLLRQERFFSYHTRTSYRYGPMRKNKVFGGESRTMTPVETYFAIVKVGQFDIEEKGNLDLVWLIPTRQRFASFSADFKPHFNKALLVLGGHRWRRGQVPDFYEPAWSDDKKVLNWLKELENPDSFISGFIQTNINSFSKVPDEY